MSKTAAIMKEREFRRFYYGAVGASTVSQTILWFLTCILLLILYLISYCYRISRGTSSVAEYLNFTSTVGSLRTTCAISIPLTLILMLRFGGTKTYHLSILYNKLLLILFIIFGLISVTTDLGANICDGEVHQHNSLIFDAVIIPIFTLPQLLIFVGSTINCVFGPMIFKLYLNHLFRWSWRMHKQEEIELQLPLPESYSSKYHGSFEEGGEGGIVYTPPSCKVKLGRGVYCEVKVMSSVYYGVKWIVNSLIPKAMTFTSKERMAVYVGEVDGEGQPHGFGHWRSDTYHGETLVGYWHHGAPVAPFKSREFGTGSGFMSIRMAWVKASSNDDGLEFGLGDAECCVSGAFFRSFPHIILYPLNERQGIGAYLLNKIPGHRYSRRFFEQDEKIAAQMGDDDYKSEDEAVNDLDDAVDWVSGIPASSRSVREYVDGSSKVVVLPTSESAFIGDRDKTRDGGPTHKELPKAATIARQIFRRRKKRDVEAGLELRRNKEFVHSLLLHMMPHLPNFGITGSSELQISVDSEKGLYIAGWLPLSSLSIQKERPIAGGGIDREPSELIYGCKPTSVDRRLTMQYNRRGSNLRYEDTKRSDVSSKIEDPSLKIILLSPEKEEEGSRICRDGNEGVALREETSSVVDEELQPPLDDGVDPLAYERNPQRLFPGLASKVELHVDGWVPTEAAGTPEAWIYCHGYNNTLAQSVQILGQMASFGNFPSYIKPFIFTWPAGSNFLEFVKARDNSRNARIHNAFKSFLVALRDNGIQNFHIMGHSMGARLLILSLRKIINDIDLFNLLTPEYKDTASNTKANLVTLTLLNPEYGLEEFVEKEYAFLRRYCSNISLFCDSRDGALKWAELLSRKKELGRSVFDIHSYKKTHLTNSNFEPSPFAGASMVQFAGREPSFLKSIEKQWLDVDVIDMTWLESNVHAIRHSYWPLNPQIIEDIRELIVTRKRARQRSSRLDRREGNVWVYRVAPSNITSIFERDF